MKATRDFFLRIISSHKTVFVSIAMSAISTACTALVTQIGSGQINFRAVLLAGASTALTALAGYAKSPATPKYDPPTPPKDEGN